jgi:hypothetical protein
LCTFAHGETEIRTKNQNNVSGMGIMGPNQGMPLMNQFMPGYLNPLDNPMYGMGMGMGIGIGMGIPNHPNLGGGK